MDDGLRAGLFALVLGFPMVVFSLLLGAFWSAFMMATIIVTIAASFVVAAQFSPQEESTATSHERTQNRSQADSQPDDTADALETLRDRYARGELTDPEFEQRAERLLETETVDAAREHVLGDSESTPTETDAFSQHEANTDRERETETDSR
ncbi:SHOCT domain-containing protein [Natronolimnobius sp. AArcel1]|uniref:SHOCT domain-containing protein n=1 Tax=Natronolimnobius sp. AArcel1 TaxID=1679093 RepID=UPI0013ECBAD0|nr:SHOCT domain-containing protein [Natronolimnobius sp. AArcel1]NGM71585.1 SHOCT domain-containing protein [Natronolimnobius sp. AArcel1]